MAIFQATMIPIAFSVLTFIAYHTVSAISPLCGAPCICNHNDEEKTLILDCSIEELSIVPPVSDWPDNVTHLDLSTNFISRLDVELAHSSLRSLDLSHNKIETIVQSAFGGLKSLKSLNLASNNIKHFEDDGFYGLDQLKSLNLSNNGLHELPDKLFYHFIGLQELSLSENPLIHLDPFHFNRMISLRWLDLSYIDAYTLDAKIFHTTGQLEFLDLSGNAFYDVPIDALRSAKSLKHLKLNENPIISLSRKSFAKLGNIEILELNFMENLKDIADETFSEMSKLRVLEIKYNRHLTYISPKAFSGLFNESRSVLEELDLEGNQLRTLQDTMVPCARLRKFNVQQNPWLCDCMFGWIKECEIQKVYLADLKCASPSRLAESLIVHLKNDEFQCEYMDTEIAKQQIHHDRIVRSVSVGFGVTLLVALALGLALLFKWRAIREWYRDKRKGPGAVYYVRARANPREI